MVTIVLYTRSLTNLPHCYLPGFIAAAFLIISAATLAYPNPRIYGEMFVLPIGVLFAFTSIRANLPGAPAGFG